MKTKRKPFLILSIAAIAILCLVAAAVLYFVSDPWGFAREVSPEEAAVRMKLVENAEKYLGCNEADGSHKGIIDLYNDHEPLAQDYVVQYTDSWCATFVSAMAIECGLTDIIPTECGCQRQIGLFSDLSCWQENDGYIPLPGDIIFYAWDEAMDFGDCTGWSDHVGIVAGTIGPFIKVIEGNKDDAVSIRYIIANHPDIRGYGLPDYGSVA